MEAINPIAWVCPISNLVATASGYTYTRGTNKYPSAPGSYEWLDQDISSPDAGRTADAVMHKELIDNAIKCNLSWNYRHTAEIKSVLNAFRGEYFEVVVYDPCYGKEENNYMMRYVMYKGDRSVKMYNASMGLMEQTSFNVIDTCIKPTPYTVTHSAQITNVRLYLPSTMEQVSGFEANDIGEIWFSAPSSDMTFRYYEGGTLRTDLNIHYNFLLSHFVVPRHRITGDINITINP